MLETSKHVTDVFLFFVFFVLGVKTRVTHLVAPESKIVKYIVFSMRICFLIRFLDQRTSVQAGAGDELAPAVIPQPLWTGCMQDIFLNLQMYIISSVRCDKGRKK